MITHALEIEDDLGGYSDKERTQITDALMSHNPTQLDKVFGMLFIKQTDELSNLLPGLFEKTSDYMKLLFVPNYSNGVIKELVDEIPEEEAGKKLLVQNKNRMMNCSNNSLSGFYVHRKSFLI